jgi:DNA-binding PadR family transcriptional regulator
MALSHAILAVLSDRACSGYDLAKQFDGSVGFFWNASHQQIYRELAQLEAKGLVELEVIRQSGRPDKKLYSISTAGTTLLCEWISQESALPPIKDELLIKLFAGYLVPIATTRNLMQQQREQHQANLETYQAIERNYFANLDELSIEMRFQYLTLQNGIHFETGWLAWCDETMVSLDNFPCSDLKCDED